MVIVHWKCIYAIWHWFLSSCAAGRIYYGRASVVNLLLVKPTDIFHQNRMTNKCSSSNTVCKQMMRFKWFSLTSNKPILNKKLFQTTNWDKRIIVKQETKDNCFLFLQYPIPKQSLPLNGITVSLNIKTSNKILILFIKTDIWNENPASNNLLQMLLGFDFTSNFNNLFHLTIYFTCL